MEDPSEERSWEYNVAYQVGGRGYFINGYNYHLKNSVSRL